MRKGAGKKDYRILVGVLVLLVVLGLSASSSLTGLVTAGSTDKLTVSEVENLSVFISGSNYNFAALKFCSRNPDAFRFGQDNTNCIYLITKNNPATSPNPFVGYVLYQNSSSHWINVTGTPTINVTGQLELRGGVKWRLTPTAQSGRSDLEVTLPQYYNTGTMREDNIRVLLTLNKQKSIPFSQYRWQYKYIKISVYDVDDYDGGKWILFYNFVSPLSRIGNFRDTPGSSTSNFVTYEHGWAMFCSPSGSCVSDQRNLPSAITIDYKSK